MELFAYFVNLYFPQLRANYLIWLTVSPGPPKRDANYSKGQARLARPLAAIFRARSAAVMDGRSVYLVVKLLIFVDFEKSQA
jgi:hypothetical protein